MPSRVNAPTGAHCHLFLGSAPVRRVPCRPVAVPCQTVLGRPGPRPLTSITQDCAAPSLTFINRPRAGAAPQKHFPIILVAPLSPPRTLFDCMEPTWARIPPEMSPPQEGLDGHFAAETCRCSHVHQDQNMRRPTRFGNKDSRSQRSLNSTAKARTRQ